MEIPHEVHEFPLTLRVPKSAFVIVAPPPATVTQRTVEQHFGITPSTFKQMVRDGLLPSKQLGQAHVVAYEDVRRALTDGAEARRQVRDAVARAALEPKQEPMSIDAAAEYLRRAATPRERRERRSEIDRLAGELSRKHGPVMPDGSPNPKHDARMLEHASCLRLTAAGGVMRNPPSSAPVPPGPTQSGRPQRRRKSR